jgi:hypothetical protein
VSPSTLSDSGEGGFATEVASAWRDSAEAALRFWGRLGRLAMDSVAALVGGDEESRPAQPRPAPQPAVPRTILVEAEAGESGMGVFLVENTTNRRLSIPVSLSSLLDAEGREVHPAVTFRPETITLDPGDQLAVQVTVAVDETLVPDVRYHAQISVPELSEARIPIAVRRRGGATPGGRRKPKVKAKTRAA